MSDDSSSRSGSAADRKITTTNAVATGAAGGLTIGFCDWLFLQCMIGGHFHFVAPSQQLIEVAAPILVLPIVLWFGNIVSLIGRIITNRLAKDAGPA